MGNDAQDEEIIHQPGEELRLWAAALYQAYVDYWSGEPALQADAVLWMFDPGGMFGVVCELFNVHPERARAIIFTKPATRTRRGFAVTPLDGGGRIAGQQKLAARRVQGA